MQNVLSFIIISLLFLIAGNAMLKIFFEMIQSGGALDIVFGWQKMLERLYGSTKKWKQLLGKALGDCERCTAFWFMPFWFICYYAFSNLVLHRWITTGLDAIWAICLINWIWLSLFWSIGAQWGLLFLLYKRKK